MKNSNSKIYMTSPVALMASIVAEAENSANHDYNKAAEQTIKLYSGFGDDSVVVVCEAPETEMIKEEDALIVLNLIHGEFGTIRSFKAHHFNSETSVYKLECSRGMYKMILVIDSEYRISAIDFSKEGVYEMKLAA
ncbi:MAG: hypothetical protein ABIT08_01680 [Bacteroidia bacterium]